jgi:amino acid permease
VFTGIISDLFPQLPDPLPWYLSRTALLTWIALAAAPLLSAKSLHGLAFVSAVSVACSTASMLCLLALWGGAAARGMLAPLRLWPKLSFFGDRPAIIATHMIATLPVVMTAFVCQMSVHPIARDLDNYTHRKIRTSVASSLSICALVYIATAASGFQIFGDDVAGDVLSNVQPEVVAAILGCNDKLGLAFVALLKSFVALSMLTSIPINIWPLREEVTGLLTHAFHGQEISKTAFYAITYGCLFGIWATAVAVESAFAMVGMIGSTCGIAIAFIFPGMLALRIQGVKGAYVGGMVLLCLGGVLMVAGVASILIGTEA